MNIQRFVIACGIWFALAGCGGGGGGGDIVSNAEAAQSNTAAAANVTPVARTNVAPVANAGVDKTVASGTTVTLTGATGTDANSDHLTYTWSFVSKPPGSTATLSDPASLAPTFFPDKPGTYKLGLTVNDGKVNSVQATVTITATGMVAINANRVSGVAPLAVHFNSIGSTSPGVTSLPFHEIKYTWNFGDIAGGATWAYGTRAGIASKNAASGPVAAHVFETPGTYLVTLNAFDGLVTRSTTTTISVKDPNVVYAGSTLCVSNTTMPVAGAGGCPVGALTQLMSNWASLGALANLHKRILLKRGDAWVATSSVTIGSTNPGGTLGAYGIGAKPQVVTNSNNATLYLNGATDWRVIELNFNGTGAYGSDRQALRIFNSKNTLVKGYETSGLWFGINANNNDNLAIIDSYIHDTEDMGVAGPIGIYAEKTVGLSMLGCLVRNIKQNHSVRYQGASNAIIANNTIDLPRPTGHVLTVRGMPDPVKGTWGGLWAEDIVISENVLDGSTDSAETLKVGPQDSISGERVRNVIVEKNLIKSFDRGAIWTEVAENMTIRNNILVTLAYGYNILVAPASNAVGMTPSPVGTYIYNNTGYKPNATIANGYSFVYINDGGTEFEPKGTVISNNIAYAPGDTKDARTNGFAPAFLNALSVNVSAYVQSSNSLDTQVKSANPFVVANPIATIDFTPVGYALGSGVNVPVWDDFFGASRLGGHSMGAINP